MTPEEKKEFDIGRINRFLFELKHMHGDEALAEAYAALQRRLANDKSALTLDEEKGAYRRLVRNMIIFLVGLKGQLTEEKDYFDSLIEDVLQNTSK